MKVEISGPGGSSQWHRAALVQRSAILVAVLAAAGLAGALVAAGLWNVAIAAAVAIPIVAIGARHPFAGVLLWVLLVPYFVQQVDASLVVWALHRLAIPGLLLLTVIHDALEIRRSQLRIHLYDVALALFLTAGLMNILMSAEAPMRTLVAFYDQMAVPVLFFWLVRAIGPGRADLGRLAIAGVGTIAVQAAIGFLSWSAADALPAEWLGRAGERTVGTFGGPAPYTITLVLFGLLALYSAMSTLAPGRRLIMFGAAATALTAILASLSRGSWLGAGMALVGLAVVYPRRIAGFGVAALLLVVLLAIGPLAEEVSRAEERLGTERTVHERTVTNAASVRMIADYPVAGVGYGNFDRFDEQYKRRGGDVPLILGGSSHNTYLNLLVEFGIPVTVMYLSPPIVLLALTIRQYRKNPHSRVVDWRLIGVLWLALLDQFVVSNFLEIIHSSLWATSLWWLTLGLIVSILDRLENEAGVGLVGPGRIGQRPTWP